MLKVTHSSVIILQTMVVVSSLGQYGLPEIRLKSQRSFGCLPCFFTERDRRFKSVRDVSARLDD